MIYAPGMPAAVTQFYIDSGRRTAAVLEAVAEDAAELLVDTSYEIKGNRLQAVYYTATGPSWRLRLLMARVFQDWGSAYGSLSFVELPGTYRDLLLDDEGLVAYWSLGDADNSVLADQLGRYPLIKGAGVVSAPSLLAASGDGSADFTAQTALTERVATPELAFAGLTPFSVEFWAATSATTGTRTVIAQESPAGWFISWNLAGNYQFARRTAAGVATNTFIATASMPNVLNGLPHHLVATFSVSPLQYQLYLDGVLIRTTNTTALMIEESLGPLVLGGARGGAAGARWPGRLDDVAIYDRALSGAEVQDHFLAGSTAG